ncbi:hypothetical protein AKJ09_04951 [Labilithrix luteola]|uniref:Uncharacterized protein n=1 Tax=Labilithrix luteola TaxID=1391654 RepID=A0A0K1PXQ4_9BACT|nr:hypothetical protein AKJ09_04951 [Labilithrix luteola]
MTCIAREALEFRYAEWISVSNDVARFVGASDVPASPAS